MKSKTKKTPSPPYISIIVPVHNEEKNIGSFLKRTTPILKKIAKDNEIIFIDDGSTDATEKNIKLEAKRNKQVKLISFSRNFGKEAALSAGIEHASGKAIIPMDVDLQDPPDLIPGLVKKWEEGFEVVNAKRNKRQDGLLKDSSAKLFYKLLGKLSNCDIPENVGDFRLIDQKVAKIIKQLPERTRFMKGLIAWPGFRTATINYDRPKRKQGSSNWNMIKLWNFALDGIFSFSTAPLKVWSYIGAVISIISLLYALYLIVRTVLFGVDVPGYASIMTAVLFMGGVQLITLGIIGEYIARIYRETKQRPLYVIQDTVGIKKTK